MRIIQMYHENLRCNIVRCSILHGVTNDKAFWNDKNERNDNNTHKKHANMIKG